ncbi:hypothetical protein KFK09_009924 [Dendrobium nobile]|uniref:Uncharacterized protein n=1 Tax=Dendrobium nobile TaxID=94219 RepID=A0A8T3BKQ1_DENNO|nr:hypothetical protein KFK09_009924 [Dendrobium nobile]
MEESSKRAALDNDRSLNTLWEAQSSIIRQLEQITTEFFHFSVEIRNEIQSLKLVGLTSNAGRFSESETTLAIGKKCARIANAAIPIGFNSEDDGELQQHFDVSDCRGQPPKLL